jgi:hypothetical protein
MTEQEKEIMRLIVDAHNMYCNLEGYHPDDISEWCEKIHDLQRMLMSRVAVRQEPELFYKKQG